MPRYKIDVKDFLLFEEEAKAIYEKTSTRAEAFAVSALWLVGPRPQELLMMKPEAVQEGADGLLLAIPTLKREGKRAPKKEIKLIRKTDVRPNFSGELVPFPGNEEMVFALPAAKAPAKPMEFQVTTRLLGFKRPGGLDQNIYMESIIDFASRAQPGVPMLQYSTRWMEKLLNRLGQEVLHKEISPYHLRHSVFTWLARNGWDAYAIKYWKGAATLASVEQYIKARPQVLEWESLHREYHRPRMDQILPLSAYRPAQQVQPVLELEQTATARQATPGSAQAGSAEQKDSQENSSEPKPPEKKAPAPESQASG